MGQLSFDRAVQNLSGKPKPKKQKRQKVYIVTAGEYSDYHIVKVFTNREDAHIYALLDSDRNVEEYYVDAINVKTTKKYILVQYNYRYNDIRSMTLYESSVKPHITNDSFRDFRLTLDLSNTRIYQNVMRYGKQSGVIKKIVQDTFAQYLYEHETSLEELIRKDDEERKARLRTGYIMYQTAMPGQIDLKLTDFVNQYFNEHGVSPTHSELLAKAAEIKSQEEKDGDTDAGGDNGG